MVMVRNSRSPLTLHHLEENGGRFQQTLVSAFLNSTSHLDAESQESLSEERIADISAVHNQREGGGGNLRHLPHTLYCLAQLWAD